MLKKLILIIVAGGIFFVWMLYMTIRDKIKDVSEVPPFSEVVNRSVKLQRPATLVKNDISYSIINCQLYDAADEFQGSTDVDAVVRIAVPAGTILNLRSAKLIKGGTSGVTTPFVLGSLVHPQTGEEIEFEYRWGKESLEKFFDKVKKRWTFPLAVWQTTPYSGEFEMPEI